MTRKLFSSYHEALLWFIMSLAMSCANDAMMKHMGSYMSSWQVAFFRCLFSTLSLLPVMLYRGFTSFQTHRLWLHLTRGLLLFIAIGLWSYGVKTAPMATATLMSFTVPIFVLLLAPIFLKERVTRLMWLATLAGFGGILIVLQPKGASFDYTHLSFVVATLAFSLLDIINKRYITQEPMLCMLFYATLVATMLLAIPALHTTFIPTQYNLNNLRWLFALGVGSNLVLYFSLKSLAIAKASSLAPFRYLELLMSMGISYLFFKEYPTSHSYLGATLIIPSTLLIVHVQSQDAVCRAQVNYHRGQKS